MTVILINGILCLVVAVFLLVQIYRTQDAISSEMLKKFIWLYWAILMVTGIHHVFSSILSNSWVSDLVTGLSPITDSANVLAGVILSVYLANKPKIKEVQGE